MCIQKLPIMHACKFTGGKLVWSTVPTVDVKDGTNRENLCRISESGTVDRVPVWY